MTFSPLANSGMYELVYFSDMIPLCATFLFLLIVLIETAMLGAFVKGSRTRRFLDALIMNAVSAVAGLLPTLWQFGDIVLGVFPSATPALDDPTAAPGYSFNMARALVFFTLSVVLEALVLRVIESRLSQRDVWQASLLVNIISYLVMYLLLCLLLSE